MRILTGFFVLLLCPLISPGQKRATHWVFGGNGGLDFSCSPPRVYLTAFDGLEGAAAISDEDGNLLMYTNGDDVFDRSHHVMENGEGLIGLCAGFGAYASASQSTLFVPHPGNSNLYYLFTTDCAEDNYMDGVQYSLIDISLNDGLGAVISKNNPLLAPAAEKVAAVFHANGTDVWVVAHEIGSNRFLAYKVSETGLNTAPVISATGQVHDGGRGYLKFSPDGKKLAAGSFLWGLNDGAELELFSFDDASGAISSLFTLPDEIKSTYALSFSPDGTKLYSSCAWTCGPAKIVQHDLNAGSVQAIADSRFVFGHSDNSHVQGAFQLAPDGKLYFLSYGQGEFVGVISDPNKAGALANYNPELIPLDFCQVRASWGLPNFIESYFRTSFIGSASCSPADLEMVKKVDFDIVFTEECNNVILVGKSELALELGYGVAKPAWYLDYGDGQTDAGANTFYQIAHEYANPGTYTVTLTIRDLCGTKTHSEVVAIEGIANAFSYEQSCDGTIVDFTNESTDFPPDVKWNWNFGDGSPPVNSFNAQHEFPRPGVFRVTLTAASDLLCDASVEREIRVYSSLHLDLGDDVVICEGQVYTLEADANPDALYQWSNDVVSASTPISSPGAYSVTVSREDCSVTDDIVVELDDDCLDCELFIPNVFTPADGDNLNARFRLDSDCKFEDFTLKVFDRYGHLLFKTDDEEGWDGNINDIQASAGIYYFSFDITRTMINGELLRETKKGWVSLIR